MRVKRGVAARAKHKKILAAAKGFDISAVTGIPAQYYLQGLRKILLHVIDILIPLTTEGILEIRSLDAGFIPFVRKSRTDVAASLQGIGHYRYSKKDKYGHVRRYRQGKDKHQYAYPKGGKNPT